MNGNGSLTTATSPSDRWIKRVTVLAVAAVGLTAATLSYRHQFELAATHGESPLTARLLPFSIDGLLLAGTLALLYASRHRRGRALTARATVALGVAMTLWANTVHGLAYGLPGVVISGWPPVALIAAVEVLAWMVRGQVRSVPVAVTPSVTAWKPDPIRKIATDERVAPKTAQLVQRRERAAVRSALNGHGSHV
jgi:hypothetical protein